MRGIKPRIVGMLCGAAFVLASGPAPDPGSGSTSGPAPRPAPVTDATWDQIADCESDSDWSADTGNGYYGGLQIWPPTWQEAGGLGYASRPDLASRRQQITVAREILREQGWQAWSECAHELGLLGGARGR
ncbi:transglycosylase family protein [Kitasatospora sp. NBC_01287]|uniref:transglycosylase family protein n=1 Tax=Kitasatospora sp. NBC_01287 TaxID=2903573 RepID=UPI002B1E34B5|nr:transglycosylase family protein [Kitasatospora sp. NBC_01287]